MRPLLMIMLAFGLTSGVAAQNSSPNVVQVRLPDGSPSGEIEGLLEDGQPIPLEWAAQSSVAAFPATRFEMFDGHQVLYRFPMPAASKLTITLFPSSGKLINLYALRQGAQESAAPPGITSAISAEARYPIYANTGSGSRIQNPDDGVRRIEFISIDRPYSILIGVAGAQGLSEGAYKLRFDLESR